jgi:uncharacterized protein (DUF983 family)
VAGEAIVVVRGFSRRCGRCGSRGIFRSYFQLRERCPRCGYRFVREEGAFTGVMLMNITATFTLMFLSFISYVLWRGITGDRPPFAPFVVAALFSAVVVPIAFYPMAVSGWAAMDLVMRPLDPVEEAEAAVHAEPNFHR